MSSEKPMIAECSWCRDVRIDGEWVTDPDYVKSHPDREITHGMCPACASTHYPEFYQRLIESFTSA